VFDVRKLTNFFIPILVPINSMNIAYSISNADEASLLRKVSVGDEDAFTELFRRWQPFLSTHIYRITESKALTEEIVQDVFLKIWQTRETLSDVQNFKNFLLVVSKNHALNVLKKLAREFQNQEKWLKEYENAEEVHDHKQAFYSLLDEAIDKLTERQREVFLLHRHQRLTYQQIADRLGIGRESVKTHIELAVKNITSHVQGRLSVIIILLLLQG